MKPPLPNEWPKIVHEINAFKNSFNEAIVYASVGVEVVLWFFAGEVIGRRHLLGYYVLYTCSFIYVQKPTRSVNMEEEKCRNT
ncbi:ATP-synt G domain containing protein [Trichuris trichiura]|uniref:ATP-synt G domain containing protein n=1 Tax=Trichuris trichiura TaxID=36087 RepID=A0A077ZLP1_TRITR|nr:ATP-synt G domain containing protein [Trichuris trichiura]